MRMRQIVVAVGLATAVLGGTAAVPAMAQGGCGPYAHRGWNGFCRPGGGFYRPYPVYGFGYGAGWHRPWGWHRHGWGYYHRGW